MLKVGTLVRKKICIIVAGMHRSGTSAVTRVVNLLGADIARDLMPPFPGANDRGYWEPKAVVDIHNRLLHALGSSFGDPLPLPDRWFETEAAMAAKRQLADEIEKDFSKSKLFVVKDPRITRLLPLWLRLLDELGIEPVVVVPVRNPLEVAASFNKREGIGTAQSLLVYIRSYLEAELASRDRRRFFVRYDQLLSDWRILARRLRKIVGPSLPRPKAQVVAEIEGFLTLDLYRNKSTRDELASASHVAITIVEMFDRMCEAADTGTETALRTSFNRLRKTVGEATKLFQGLVVAEQEKHRSEVGRLSYDHNIAAERLQSEIASSRNRTTELEQALSARSTTLDQINLELAAARNRSAELHQVLAARSAVLAQVNAELAVARDRSMGLQQVLEARATALARVNAELVTVRSRASHLERVLEERSQTLAGVEAQLVSARNQTSELEQALRARASALAGIEADVAAARNRADELDKALQEQSAQLVRQATGLEAALAIQSSELQSIKASTSWRLAGLLWQGSQRFPRTAGLALRGIKRLWRLLGLHRISRLRHYRRSRQDSQLIKSSSLFDEAWYLAQYPDVRSSRSEAAWHYLIHGGVEGRDPGPAFDSHWYLAENPDVRAAGLNPLVHYLRYGAPEGRVPHRSHDVAKHGQASASSGGDVRSAQMSRSEQQRYALTTGGHSQLVRRAQSSPVLPGYLAVHPEIGDEPKGSLNVSVSVVIPTLNAGEELLLLVRKLRQQKGIRSIEIVVVDSGSTDGTDAVARELGCVLVKISKEQFSHSFSRNLGAEKATGDFLLFMVQDAYPIGNYWIYGLVSCLLHSRGEDHLTAVSCAEYCRSDSELLYDCAIDTHYKFLGCRDQDRIGRLTGEGHMDLRAQGQLSDVACLIPREIFQKYKFTGRYAEDLTLGIRLIRDGHKIGMLSSIPVIHSHRRASAYYLRRAFVDVVFLHEIFSDFPLPSVRSVRGTLAGAFALRRAVPKVDPSMRASPVEALRHVIGGLRELDLSNGVAGGKIEFGHAPFSAWADCINGAVGRPVDRAGEESALHLKAMFLNRLADLQLFLSSAYPALDERIASEINEAVEKTMAMSVGAQLAFLYLSMATGTRIDVGSEPMRELKALMMEGI